jgi:predicted DNA-binding protein
MKISKIIKMNMHNVESYKQEINAHQRIETGNLQVISYIKC